MKKSSWAISRQRGFSLAESLLAFVVLIISTLGTLGTLASTFSNVDQNSYRIQAIAAAQEYMDSIRHWEVGGGTGSMPAAPSIAIDAGDTSQGSGTGLTSPGTFNFTAVPATCTQTGAGGSSSKEYNCTVTVEWTTNGFTRSLAVESHVTQQ
jgi:Tfp pilus assembly protein PilV